MIQKLELQPPQSAGTLPIFENFLLLNHTSDSASQEGISSPQGLSLTACNEKLEEYKMKVLILKNSVPENVRTGTDSSMLCSCLLCSSH